MLGPISHLQIWDGEWGAHAELRVGGKAVADLVALPEVKQGVPEIVESVYAPASLKELPDDFQLLVRALDKSALLPIAFRNRYGDRPELSRRWQTTGRYDTREVSEVALQIPTDIDRVRTMSWGAGEAVWLEFTKNGLKKSLVFGPHWGGVEVLEVVTHRPADPREWALERLMKMDSPVYCAMETRR